jgi:hypothetical protein
MENNKLLIGLIAGVAVVGLYINWKNSNNIKKLAAGTLTPKEVQETIADATIVEKQKYTNAFLKDFDIVMPPVQASKAVKEKAAAAQKRRYSVNPDKLQTPLYL